MTRLTLEQTALRLGGAATLRDKLAKAEREVDRFKNTGNLDERNDAEENAAAALNELTDWSYRLHEEAPGLSLDGWRRAVETACPQMKPICDFCNAEKHRVLHRAKALDETRVTFTTEPVMAAPNYYCGTRSIPVDGTPPGLNGRTLMHKWIVNGVAGPAHPFFDAALQFWRAYAERVDPR